MKTTYIFDIDGTIADTPKGTRYDKAKPIESMITIINYLYDKGHTIIIETARGATSGKDWSELTKKQLSEWGLKYDELHFIKKPIKYLHINDCACSPEEFWELI